VVEFAGETGVLVPGAAHQQSQQALFYAVYDGSVPRRLMAPGSFSVYSVSYNAVATFEVPQGGVVIVAALEPQYVTTFSTTSSPPYTVTIPGSAHGLSGPYFFYQAYGTGDPLPAIEVGSLRVHTTTFDVTLTFSIPQSGTLLLATGTPRYIQSFTNVSDVAPLLIPGATHGLGTANLFAQVYTPSGAEVEALPIGTLTVHHATFDVTLGFTTPESGTLILTPAPGTGSPAVLAAPVAASPQMAPITTTRAVQESSQLTALQATLSAVLARLATLETTYTTLLTQVSSPNPEDPTP
jgi:hypothetical protein